MQPEIGPIKTFGVMFALGFLAAGAVIARRLREKDLPPDWAYEIVFAALFGGLVGSRLWYVLAHTSEVSDDFFGTVFGGSGLVWYGGAIGGALCVVIWGYRRGFAGWGLVDLCSAPLALGYAMGRIGCQLSGDGDYGKATSLPWGMAYPNGTVPTTTDVHPTPVYETVVMGLLAWGLWSIRDRVRPGVVFGVYLLGAGVERFLVEFIRRNDSVLLGLTEAQITSVVMALGGAFVLWTLQRRHGSLIVAREPATRARAATA